MTSTMAVPQTADIGLIGLGVMGENLALNMADHGYRVALWTRSAGKVDRVIQQHGVGRQWVNPKTLKDFTRSLTPPRRVLLMVKAGPPVDEMLETLVPYLIEIPSRVLAARDPDTGRPLIDLILDQAGQKGTGSWTVQIATELGVPIPTIAAGVDARILSSMRAERVRASRALAGSNTDEFAGDRQVLVDTIHHALSAASICSFAQGMSLLRAASAEYHWGVALHDIARIWKGGCIIRARLLDAIMPAFERDPDLPNLVLDPDIGTRVLKAERSWRRTVQTAVELAIPVPAMSASLAYFDSYRTSSLPQNLTQAQRDYFGAHTYQRADRPEDGFVHTDWKNLIEQTRTGVQR